MVKTFIFKETFVADKFDFVKVNANTEKEAKDIFKAAKGIKRMKMTTRYDECDKWMANWKKDIEINSGLNGRFAKQVALSKAKIDFVSKLKAINQ